MKILRAIEILQDIERERGPLVELMLSVGDVEPVLAAVQLETLTTSGGICGSMPFAIVRPE